jgi:hypothetical protein
MLTWPAIERIGTKFSSLPPEGVGSTPVHIVTESPIVQSFHVQQSDEFLFGAFWSPYLPYPVHHNASASPIRPSDGVTGEFTSDEPSENE